MLSKTRKKFGRLGRNDGFTLVEMALVLIIIGIIIGAVVKGKDLVRSAEQKRTYTKFLSEWRLAYLNFYDRTGRVLGDFYSATAPAGPGQDGQADTNTGGAAPNDTGRAALTDGDAAVPPAFMGLSQVGLTPIVTNIPNLPYRWRYVDSQGNSHLLDVAFDFLNNANCMLINNVPPELAIALDTMIDGEADGANGDFRNGAGLAWPTAVLEIDGVRWRMNF